MGERNDLIERLRECDQPLINQPLPFSQVRQRIRDAASALETAATTIASLSEALAEAEKMGAGDWQPIETAPKGRKILAGYFNPLGNWRTVTARYYVANTLPADDDSEEYFAPEGWYECSETNEHILQLEYPPTHWRPLPAPPRDLSQGGQHG